MGAMCGKSSTFDDLGPGQSLGGCSNSTSPTAATKATPKNRTYNPLASNQSNKGNTVGEAERREAMARAAEGRNAKGATRGTPQPGKLSAQLAASPADGGRKADAILAGSKKDSAPLVWD